MINRKNWLNKNAWQAWLTRQRSRTLKHTQTKCFVRGHTNCNKIITDTTCILQSVLFVTRACAIKIISYNIIKVTLRSNVTHYLENKTQYYSFQGFNTFSKTHKNSGFSKAASNRSTNVNTNTTIRNEQRGHDTGLQWCHDSLGRTAWRHGWHLSPHRHPPAPTGPLRHIASSWRSALRDRLAHCPMFCFHQIRGPINHFDIFVCFIQIG